MLHRTKPFAIYFPQFYPTATNDKAWGAGFTDWSLVANANMREAWTRRAPAAGFYDGSDPKVHLRQMNEATLAGLGGFAVYHYWFFSHQELSAFEQTLIGSPADSTVPWFLIWASEGWSKRWLAKPDILLHLSPAPTQKQIEVHCDHLAVCFAHPRYLRWQGKPLFAWYNLAHFHEPELVVSQYRAALLARGFEIAIAHFVKHPFDFSYCNITDASYLFEPRLFFSSQTPGRGKKSKALLDVFRKTLGPAAAESLLVAMDKRQRPKSSYEADRFMKYMESRERQLTREKTHRPCQDVISPGWNNTPRYGDKFTALQSLNPAEFGRLVKQATTTTDLPPLLNAWNEWAEGAAIEPCTYFGSRYLDAITAALAE
jgi:Glycosyltransferase WbsX